MDADGDEGEAADRPASQTLRRKSWLQTDMVMKSSRQAQDVLVRSRPARAGGLRQASAAVGRIAAITRGEAPCAYGPVSRAAMANHGSPMARGSSPRDRRETTRQATLEAGRQQRAHAAACQVRRSDTSSGTGAGRRRRGLLRRSTRRFQVGEFPGTVINRGHSACSHRGGIWQV